MLATGLYLQMCGIEFWMTSMRNSGLTRWIPHMFLEMFLIQTLLYLRVPAGIFVLFSYGMILVTLWQLDNYVYPHAIRGVVSIFLVASMELIIILGEQSEYLSEIVQGMQIRYSVREVMLILILIMVQLLTTVVSEAWRLRKRVSRYFYLIIAVKRVMETSWCYHLIAAMDYDESGLWYLLMFLISVVLDYFLIYDIEMYKVFRREKIRRVRLPLNREEYYAKMEEEHLQIRSIFHDLKNQLMILEGSKEFQSDHAQRVIADFREKMKPMGNFYHTGNTDLDIILFECRERARAKEIDLDVVIQEGCLSFMRQEDINAIFVNAMVNAIEACSVIDDGERKIWVQAGSRLNDVMISFKNTKSDRVPSQKLRTSKADKKLHGLGIPSIRRSAEKYHGYVSISEDSRFFRLVILFVREEKADGRR